MTITAIVLIVVSAAVRAAVADPLSLPPSSSSSSLSLSPSSSSPPSSSFLPSSLGASCRGGHRPDSRGDGDFGDERDGEESRRRSSVLNDVREALSSTTSGEENENDDYDWDDASAAAAAAAVAFSEAVGEEEGVASSDRRNRSTRGAEAFRFLSGLSSSPTFVREYWQRRPLLIRSVEVNGGGGGGCGCGWADGAFTVERDLRLVEGSYVSGHRTSDALRDGTRTDTWDFRPIKDDAARVTTWDDVERSLRPDPSSSSTASDGGGGGGGGGTIYFNTAGSLWPSLAALCRLASSAFGLPTNVNVYVTPPGVSTSVPPHTDRQDVLVVQTEGAKRWRVYGPPRPRKAGVDPLNRGKGGDALSAKELGEPLIDDVVRRGDVLYVPAGFPHATDTRCAEAAASAAGAGVAERRNGTERDDDVDGDGGNDDDDASLFRETSVHLTVGLDTHVWGLTYAHLRWSALQRAGKDFAIRIEDDDDYWDSLRTPPCGFLDGSSVGRKGRRRGKVLEVEKEGEEGAMIRRAVEELKMVMVRLEPERWTHGAEATAAAAAAAAADGENKEENDDAREDLPPDEDLARVARYVLVEHLGALLTLQEDEMFANVRDPRSDESMMKAYRCTQEQNKIMERFGLFSKNEAMRRSFESSRLRREAELSRGGL